MLGVMLHVVLVIVLGFEKTFADRLDCRDDRLVENFGIVQLLDVCFGDALLIFVFVEDGVAVLVAGVGALLVLHGGLRHGEENLKQRGVADLRGVVGDLDDFGVI